MSDKLDGIENIGGDQISEAFKKILANPDIINNVAEAIGISAPNIDSASDTTNGARALSSLAPLLGSSLKKDASVGISSNQASLLRSLKPYLNDNRRQAVDYIIGITEISQLLKKTN